MRQREENNQVAEGAQILRKGGLVAFPTETVYGLGADATNARAVAKLFAAKERPHFNPLIAHLPDTESAASHGLFNEEACLLAEAFWPGALTLVVPLRSGSTICDLARAGLDSVALRVPAHPLARALIGEAGRPIAAPSANRSGQVSPTRAEHVAADLGRRIALILDGGPTQIGLESTIVSCLEGQPKLLRPGGLTVAAIEKALGRPLLTMEADDPARPSSPGRLASHYAPRAGVRLAAVEVHPGEALLAFGPDQLSGAKPASVFNLSPSGDLTEAAARLFEGLRTLDASGVATIAVMSIPMAGLGLAINDRLNRAAAPR